MSQNLSLVFAMRCYDLPIIFYQSCKTKANIDALKRNETKSKMFDDDASASDVEDYFSEQE